MIKRKVRKHYKAHSAHPWKRVAVWKLGRLTLWKWTIWRESDQERQERRDREALQRMAENLAKGEPTSAGLRAH